MAVYSVEVQVVEREAMKRPPGAPDQLWGGPWFTPLDIRSDGTGKSPAPAGCFIAVVGALILFVMLCLPASYEPL